MQFAQHTVSAAKSRKLSWLHISTQTIKTQNFTCIAVAGNRFKYLHDSEQVQAACTHLHLKFRTFQVKHQSQYVCYLTTALPCSDLNSAISEW